MMQESVLYGHSVGSNDKLYYIFKNTVFIIVNKLNLLFLLDMNRIGKDGGFCNYN